MVVYTTPGIVKCESFESGKLDGFGHSQYGAASADITTHCRNSLKIVTLQCSPRAISLLVWPPFLSSVTIGFFAAGIPGYMVRHASLLAHFHTIYFDMHRTLKCPPDTVIIPVILSHLVQPAYMQFAFPLFNFSLGVDSS